MSTINEQIVTGRAHRVLIDKVAKLWQRISFWTKASDVEFNDGQTAEIKVGMINGITSDLNCEDETIAVSAAAIKDLSANFTMAADLIGDAISGLGVEVPEETSLTGMASLISLNLTKKAVKSTITMKYSGGGHGVSGIIPVTETNISGTAFTASGSSILVNHDTEISLILKVYTYAEAGTISIQKNGVTVASSPTGGSAWNYRNATFGGHATTGDIFRAAWSGTQGSLMQDVTFSATGNN